MRQSKRRPLTIPEHAHPLVRQLWAIMKAKGVDVQDVVTDAGLDQSVVYQWRVRTNPQLANIEAMLNVLGYKLVIARVNDPIRPLKPRVAGVLEPAYGVYNSG